MVPSLLPFLEMLSDRNHELGTMSVSRVRTAALQPNSSASVPAQAPAEATVGRLLHPRACGPWIHIPGSVGGHRPWVAALAWMGADGQMALGIARAAAGHQTSSTIGCGLERGPAPAYHPPMPAGVRTTEWGLPEKFAGHSTGRSRHVHRQRQRSIE